MSDAHFQILVIVLMAPLYIAALWLLAQFTACAGRGLAAIAGAYYGEKQAREESQARESVTATASATSRNTRSPRAPGPLRYSDDDLLRAAMGDDLDDEPSADDTAHLHRVIDADAQREDYAGEVPPIPEGGAYRRDGVAP